MPCLIQLTDTMTARSDGAGRSGSEGGSTSIRGSFLPTVVSALADPVLTKAAEQAGVSGSAIAQIGRDLLVR